MWAKWCNGRDDKLRTTEIVSEEWYSMVVLQIFHPVVPKEGAIACLLHPHTSRKEGSTRCPENTVTPNNPMMHFQIRSSFIHLVIPRCPRSLCRRFHERSQSVAGSS
jgi:hypothetical protein